MSEAQLLASCESLPDGGFRVRSPAVGWWSDPPRPGTLVSEAARIGRLTRLTTRYDLVLPPGVAGRVAAGRTPDREQQVEYGEILFDLSPLGESAAQEGAAAQASAATQHGPDLPPGTRALVSPTDGIFYRRPTPGAPPFVNVGSRVRVGQAVGLVEVMKTFNRVLYGGSGFPEEAEIVEVRCEDALEVHAGQVLFVVR